MASRPSCRAANTRATEVTIFARVYYTIATHGHGPTAAPTEHEDGYRYCHKSFSHLHSPPMHIRVSRKQGNCQVQIASLSGLVTLPESLPTVVSSGRTW